MLKTTTCTTGAVHIAPGHRASPMGALLCYALTIADDAQNTMFCDVHHTPRDAMHDRPQRPSVQRRTTPSRPPEKTFGRCTGPATPTSMQDHAIEYLSAHSRGSPNNGQTHFKLCPVQQLAARVGLKRTPDAHGEANLNLGTSQSVCCTS